MTYAIPDFNDEARLLDQVRTALNRGESLRIRGGNSKAFLGRQVHAPELDTRTHTGVVHYDPTELVVTVRAGTRLRDLNAVLASQGQHFPPEAPDYNGLATVGGMVAGGLAGPRRPWAGSVRDHVLGCRFVSGQAKALRFGGEVMKNVAGYDFSRLLAGSLGCLGLITELSLKVLPLPRAAHHLSLEMDAETALHNLVKWRRDDLPISGAFHWNKRLHIRLEGGEATVKAARLELGGTETPSSIWTDLREQRLPFFQAATPLWRVSVPWRAPLNALPGDTLIDWGGAQRWLLSDAPAEAIRGLARSLGGHATCHTPQASDDPFQPLPEALSRFHLRLKAQVDPQGVFNPGRMYVNL